MAALPILYDYPLAYYPAKPRLMLVEKGVPYTTKFINLFNGQSLCPAYLRTNPQGLVPFLVVGDKAIGESLDITKYVDENLGGPALGGDRVDRAFIEQWGKEVHEWDGNLFFAANGGDQVKSILGKLILFRERYAKARMKENPDLAPLYKERLAAMAAAAKAIEDQAAIDKNDKILNELLDTAESRLKASGAEGWLAGPTYSLADVLLTVLLFRIEMGKQQAKFIEPRPALNSYYKRVQQRPSWNKVFGPALSGFTAARLFLPALAKAWWANLTGRY